MLGGRRARGAPPAAGLRPGSAATLRRAAALLLSAAALSLAALSLAALSLAAAGCGSGPAASGGPPAGSPAPHPGGTYEYPLQSDPRSLLPPHVDDSAETEVGHQIFEGLVAYEARDDGTVVTVPCLAESWSANADASVWTFRLRRGVRFQAPVGREVTAGDVVAALRYLADRRHGSFLAYMYAVIAGTDEEGFAAPRDLAVAALDRYTVRFTLKRPFAVFPETVGHAAYWVWPVDYLRRVGRAGFEASPAGTGPFVLSRRVRGEYIDLRRNPSWWNASSGQPYLEGVHFRVFESVSAELLAFQKGLIDYTWVPQGQVAASRSLPQVRSGEWEAKVLPVQGVFYVAFFWDDPVVGREGGRTVREALDCAVDRAALVAAVGDGVYIPQTGLVPAVFPGWKDEQPAQAYDPRRARVLYEQAGSPPLELTYWDDRAVEAGALWLRDACAAAGIPLELRRITWEQFGEAVYGGGSGLQVFFTGWLADYPSDDDFLYPTFFSGLSASSLGTAYADADVDRLLTLARSTADPARRLDLSRRAAHEILADKPALPLFEFADYRLLSTRVGGFTAPTAQGVDMWRLWVK